MAHVTATKVRVPEIGVAKDEPTQIDLAEIGTAQVGAPEVNGVSTFDVLVEGLHFANSEQAGRQDLAGILEPPFVSTSIGAAGPPASWGGRAADQLELPLH